MATQRRRGLLSRWILIGALIVVVAGAVGGGLALRSPTSVAAAPGSILGWSPGVTRGLPLTAPITVYFSRDMDRASVERSWRLSPSTPGHFSWTDTSMSFVTDHPLQSGQYYRLAVGWGARDGDGKRLNNPLSVAFTTGDALKMLDFTPADGASGVPLNGLISLTFNHPMVALAGLSTTAPAPSGWDLTISPHTAGHGSWLGTSTWVFHPDAGLLPSSTYHVTLSGAARDASGEALGAAVHFSFHTAGPEVIGTQPKDGERFANPAAPVKVVFNQPMDPSVDFSLEEGGAAVPGSITWSGSTLLFHSLHPLDATHPYTAVVRGARSANRAAALSHPVRWSFQVARPPRVLSFFGPGSPGNGATLRFSAPMDKSSLDQRLTLQPAISPLDTYSYSPDSSGSLTDYVVSGNFQPSTAYTLSIAPGAKDTFGRILASSYATRFTTPPLSPSVVFYGADGTGSAISISAGSRKEAPIQLVNIPSVHYILVRADLSAQNSASQFGGPLTPPTGKTVRDWTVTQRVPPPHPLNATQNLGVALANPDGSPLAPGLYWLGAQGLVGGKNPPVASELIVVSNVGVTVKTTSTQTLVWVTSAATGKALAGAAVHLVDDKGNTLHSGPTDVQGLHLFKHSANDMISAAVVDDGGPEGARFGMASTNWQATTRGMTYSPVDATGHYTAPSDGAYLYTDRPIYRPGQRVDFRAVLWRDRDAVYRLYSGQAVEVRAMDARGREVYSGRPTLDRFGAVDASFALPNGVATGDGQITASLPGSGSNPPAASTSFSVADYRKPEFLTDVSASQRSYTQGQTMVATAHVRYLFGAPVIGQRITWTAYLQSQVPQPAGWDGYQFGDGGAIQADFATPNFQSFEGQFGAIITQGQGTTDGAGTLAIRVPVDLSKTSLDGVMTIEVTTTDINNQSVTGRVQFPVYKANTAIGLAPQSQVVAVGQQTSIGVVTVNQDGTILPHRALHATIYRRTYNSQLTSSISIPAYWKQVPHDSELLSKDLTTDSKALASIDFTPQAGGAYYISVEGPDGTGNAARSAVTIDASTAAGTSAWSQSEDTSLTLKPDHTEYAVGQTAHILVPSPFPDATALVTMERGGIRSFYVRKLASTSSTVDVPITINDIPNVYVSLSIYRGWRNGSPPDWRSGVANLKIRLDPRRVVVRLSQDRSHYHPSDTVTYTVRTTDTRGRPLSTQLSLALVDGAVLALQDETNGDIVKALYSERTLDVTTASEGVVSIDHLSTTPTGQLHPFGGLGGGGGGLMHAAVNAASLPQRSQAPSSQNIRIRSHFADTAYWRANLVTDTSGTATVRVPLPDNLTTWRLDARAISRGLSVGGAHLTTPSTQDLIIRPVTPRFLLQGDRVQLGAVINNNLDSSVTSSVSLQAQGVTLQAGASADVTVPAHGERLLLWSVTVDVTDHARLTIQAQPSTSGVRGDATAISLPVHPPLTDETVATAGQVYGQTQQLIMAPAAAQGQLGSLSVQVSSFLTAGIGQVLASVRATSYDSNDDIASRLLVASALETLPPFLTGLSHATTSRLSAIVRRGLVILEGRQLSDGGWPWFNGPGAQSDPTITADVMLALTRANARDVAVLRAGRAYLRAAIKGASASDRAHLQFVLAVARQAPGSSARNLFGDAILRSHLDPAALAELAWTLRASGDTSASGSLLAGIDASAMVSATGAHWEGSIGGEPAIEATARVLQILVALSPHDPFVPAAARWLMLARYGPSWDCGRDSALAVTALAAYAHAANEGKARYRYSVIVDGATKGQGEQHDASSTTVGVPMAALHRGGTSSLVLARRPTAGNLGPGPFYYVARLHYFLPAATIAARNEGIGVQRSYLDLSGHPLTSTPVGTVFRVRLTLSTGQTLLHVSLDDPLAAGVEVINQGLNTSRQGLLAQLAPPTGTTELVPYLIHSDLRDDRVSLYADYLPPGIYTYSYLAEATVAGAYGVAPAKAAEAFFPEVFGRSAGKEFRVK